MEYGIMEKYLRLVGARTEKRKKRKDNGLDTLQKMWKLCCWIRAIYGQDWAIRSGSAVFHSSD